MCAKTACVYHSVDLDGWMSAAIIKKWWNEPYNQVVHEKQKDTIDFIGYNYGDPIPDMSLYDRVIMCDISFPQNEMLVLWETLGQNFIWIDHHISAMKQMDNLHENIASGQYPIAGLRDVKYSACELVWMYIYNGIRMDSNPDISGTPNPMPEIVRLLGRYDCFGHKGTDEEQKVLEFQYGARSYIDNYESAYRWLIRSVNQQSEETSPEKDIQKIGTHIYKYLCMEAQQSYKNGFEIPLSIIAFKNGISYPNEMQSNPEGREDVSKNYKFICINKERFNPINFGIDYHADGYDGAACFHRRNDGKWAFSLYNDNGLVDCSQIAKIFGGGGHKGASGFVIDDISKIL